MSCCKGSATKEARSLDNAGGDNVSLKNKKDKNATGKNHQNNNNNSGGNNGAAFTAGGGGSPTAGGGNIMNSSTLEEFLKSTLAEAERFIMELSDPPATKQAIAVTFLNSIAELARNKWRCSFTVARETMQQIIQKQKMTLFTTGLETIQEQYMDDGFTRLLAAWRSHNPTSKKKITVDELRGILEALYIHLEPTSRDNASFYDVIQLHFRWIACNTAALEVFTKFADCKETMSAEQLGRFLRETQRLEVTDRQLIDKFTYRYGGVIHRYNFACYNGSVLTNCAIDPARTSDVWQDMTQSFTRYVLSCARVDSPASLARAIAQEAVRAVVLPSLKKVRSPPTSTSGGGATSTSSGAYVCGTCPLTDIISSIKKYGFEHNTYPIVVCLPPASTLPKEQQVEVAKLLTDGFGAMLGKGLMLEGSVISDPKFSPGALRKKVLIMGSQGPLKPFVGFMVADMNKDGLGVRVTDVVEGTPAAKGGIAKDDWLTHVNGTAIPNKQTLRALLNRITVGSEISIKRENMDELKIIVGGVVDPTQAAASGSGGSIAPELSNVIFFKYGDGSDVKPKQPWDTTIITKEKLHRTAAAKTAKDSAAQLKRSQFDDHFAITSIDGAEAEAGCSSPIAPRAPSGATTTTTSVDLLGTATRLGIQFVDVDNSERCLAWSRGRFTDNGRCGYLLKPVLVDAEVKRDVAIDIIVGPRAIGNPPLRRGVVELFGPGSAKMVGSNVMFTGCTESTIGTLRLFFEVEGVEEKKCIFIAAFCPALCRPGFRALPCQPALENVGWKGGGIHGTYVFVKL